MLSKHTILLELNDSQAFLYVLQTLDGIMNHEIIFFLKLIYVIWPIADD